MKPVSRSYTLTIWVGMKSSLCVNVNLLLFGCQGGREVKDFLNFLKREATNPLVLKGAKEEL